VSGTPCAGNSADDRSVWCDQSIDTDYYNVVPETGVTREYWLNLVQVNIAPDGFERMALTVNGTIPGPTIVADWGDWIVVHVTNNLLESQNGTSIHWHGIRQNYTNQADGVVSVTQCPTAPGETYTYKFRATQYGSSWYHSHFALQAWEGVFGGISTYSSDDIICNHSRLIFLTQSVINGPSSANYDEDLGIFFIGDWTHQTVDQMYDNAQVVGAVELQNGRK
jgi:NADH:ubiquinone oxidoreductase subunit